MTIHEGFHNEMVEFVRDLTVEAEYLLHRLHRLRRTYRQWQQHRRKHLAG